MLDPTQSKMDWYYKVVLVCVFRCWAPWNVYRCWSHCFIVSFPFSNHLSLKDFMLLDLFSSLLLRIFAYSILILLFILATHLLLVGRAGFLFGRLLFHFCISIGARLSLIQLTCIFLLPCHKWFSLAFQNPTQCRG